MNMAPIDAIVNSGRWAPRWGWHDDHRQNDRKPEYLPAIQQVRSEFVELAEALESRDLLAGRCLQLGIGEIECSHEVWTELFAREVITLDWRVCRRGRDSYRGLDIRSADAVAYASSSAPYDLLFIDAGHSLDAVKADHEAYGHMVRSGGIIAFHDALKRSTYEDEIQVWRYLEQIESNGINVHRIGSEVGVAWIVKD